MILTSLEFEIELPEPTQSGSVEPSLYSHHAMDGSRRTVRKKPTQIEELVTLSWERLPRSKVEEFSEFLINTIGQYIQVNDEYVGVITDESPVFSPASNSRSQCDVGTYDFDITMRWWRA